MMSGGDGRQELAIDRLRQVLPLEYGFMRYYERLLPALDEDTAGKVRQLLEESAEHARITSDFLRELGAEGDIDTSQMPEAGSDIEAFRRQLEKERLARWLQFQAAEAVESEDYRRRLLAMASQEETHILLVESILQRLEGLQ